MRATLKGFVPVFLLAVIVAGFVFLAPSIGRELAYAAEQGRIDATRERLAELSKHDQLSVLFREVAKATKPAVVVVRTKRIETTRPIPFGSDDLFRRFFGESFPRRLPRQRLLRGLGSGVIVDAENGYVLTNNHVVAGSDEVEVVLPDKRILEAQWVRTDWKTDLAVVKIKPERLTAAPLGDSDAMEVGDWVLAVGAPRGLSQSVTAGIISAKGRKTSLPAKYQNYIQTDAAINRGNSGGPLVNMRGEVIGINNAISSYSGGNEGIGFAIPSNMAKRVMTELIEKGKVVRGWLGVQIQDVTDRLAKNLKLPSTSGAMIARVLEDTPAHRAELKEGDFIVSVDSKSIEDAEDLTNVIAAIKPGTTVKLGLYRDGKKITVKVKLGAQPDSFEGAEPGESPKAPADRFGLEVETLDETTARRFGFRESLEGVVVVSVDPSSDAAEQGIVPGMVITHVQGKPVTTEEEFRRALSKAGDNGVRIRLALPSGARRIMVIEPSKPSE